MNKRIRLLDYKNNPKWIVIKNFEKVKECIFEIVSGDGTLMVVYDDNSWVDYDSNDHRYLDYFDGCWIIPPKEIGILNKLKDNHYDSLTILEKWFV